MTEGVDPRRIVFGVTSHVSAYAFLVGHLKYVSSRGWDVHLIVGSDHADLEEFARSQAVTLHVLKTSRNPSPVDLLFIVRLARLVRVIRPSITVMATPKMGVFGTIAAALVRVPVRTYYLLGFKWDGLSGIVQRLVRGLDRVACRAATDVVPISRSLRQRTVDEKISPSAKIHVLGPYGSTIAVDVTCFQAVDAQRREELRREVGIPTSARTVSFVARLTRDKGIEDLPVIWTEISKNVPDAWLLVVGDPEPGESVNNLRHLERVKILGHTSEVEKVFQLADLNLSLSKREGLGMVPLEAAACGIPTVAFAVTGIVDTVQDRVTGRLADPGDVAQMTENLRELLTATDELARLGGGAHAYVGERYSPNDVWGYWQEFLESRYDELTATGGLADKNK